MKLFFVLFLSLVLLSGCLELYPGEEKPLIYTGDFEQDDWLRTVSFSFPDEIYDKEGLRVSLYLVTPDDTISATYSETFYTKDFEFTLDRMILYYPGVWGLRFTVSNSNQEILEGNHYFYVSPKSSSLARFSLEYFQAPKAVACACTFDVTFSIRNSGNTEGYVSIVLYDQSLAYVGEKWVYGVEYYLTERNIDVDYTFEESVSIQNPRHDMNLVLIYGDQKENRIVRAT